MIFGGIWSYPMAFLVQIFNISSIIASMVISVSRHEKDHRSGPKTRTGPDSGPSPRPKKISQNPRTCNGLGPIRVRSKSDSDLGYTQIQAGKS